MLQERDPELKEQESFVMDIKKICRFSPQNDMIFIILDSKHAYSAPSKSLCLSLPYKHP